MYSIFQRQIYDSYRFISELMNVFCMVPAMESRLSTLATCGFGVRTSLEANRLSCPRLADTAM